MLNVLAMDRLCASLGFARRTARRLHLANVAEELSQLLHEVHSLQADYSESDQGPAQTQPEATQSTSLNQERLAAANIQARRRRPKRKSIHLVDPQDGDQRPHACDDKLMEEMLPAPRDATPAQPPLDFQDLLAQECQEENLRAAIHHQVQQLQAVDEATRDVVLNQVGEQSFEEVAKSRSKHIVFQVFRARAHLFFLEEWLTLICAKPLAAS